MRILIVGNGGREHALLWKLRRDAPGAEFFFTAGNAGMAEIAEPIELAPTDVPGLLRFAGARRVDLTVIGPELPLAMGIVDAFADAGLAVFGPRRAAAEIEASKAFAKSFMVRQEIPTADFQIFTDPGAADAFLRTSEGPIVVKASGLMGGKGAVVCATRDEAREVAAAMLRAGTYGEAGREVVIEQLLEGTELSLIALTDGGSVLPLLPVRDHKRVFEGERGPNTGGMGAIAPVADVTPDLLEEIAERVLRPAVRALTAEGRPFRGALYAGLMLTESGPRVVEFNARFGDPETQAILPLLESSLLELLLACAEPGRAAAARRSTSARLVELAPRWREGAACCVVVAAAGYPGPYDRGLPIELGEETPEALVFHAGTARRGGQLVSAGGRVLGVTGLGADAAGARAAAYARLERVQFEGMHYRRDIGLLPVAAG